MKFTDIFVRRPVLATVISLAILVLGLRAVSSLPIPIVQLDPDLPLPKYAHEGDAGMDLYAAEDATIASGGGRALVATGISIAIPIGYGGFVLPRSGMALKHGISVVNAPGLIDAAYRGEIKVILINTDRTADYVIERGDRVAQLVIQAVETVEWHVTDDLERRDHVSTVFEQPGERDQAVEMGLTWRKPVQPIELDTLPQQARRLLVVDDQDTMPRGVRYALGHGFSARARGARRATAWRPPASPSSSRAG